MTPLSAERKNKRAHKNTRSLYDVYHTTLLMNGTNRYKPIIMYKYHIW